MKEKKTGPHAVRLNSWTAMAPFEELLGIHVVSLAPGEAVLAMPFVKSLSQGLGYMHGGALVTLADTALASAIKGLLPPGTIFATISMQSRFLRPVTRGVVTARAVMTGRRGRDLLGEVVLKDDDGREVMLFSAVFRVARTSWPAVAGRVTTALPEAGERRRAWDSGL